MEKKVRVAKGVALPRGEESKLRKKAGSGSVGRYKNVKPVDFAGKAGGASKYSYPINTEKRAKAALAYARNAPNPEGIKKKVYEKYPDLKKRHEKRMEK